MTNLMFQRYLTTIKIGHRQGSYELYQLLEEEDQMKIWQAFLKLYEPYKKVAYSTV